jgi:ABC-2 type transport system permease protein
MVPILILAASVLFAVFRRVILPRRSSTRVTRGPRRRPALPALTALLAASGDVGLVAAREVRQRIGGRVFRVGTVLMLTAAAAAIVVPVLERGAHTERVGVVGALSAPARAAVVSAGTSVGDTVHLVGVSDAAAARAALRSGRIDVAVIDGGQVVVKKPVPASNTSSTAELARALARTVGSDEAVRAAGLSAAQVTALAGARPLPVRSLEPGGISTATRSAAIAGLILLFLMLTQYNTWTLVGVMEEKASRVIEVLLAAVGPAKLLSGKVLGIGVVVFAQAALVVAFSIGLAHAVGSDLVHGSAPGVLVSALVWLVFGYAFYSWVYAAAGAMIERQAQVQALAFPLALPIIFAYFMATTALASGAPSTFFEALAYVPPTAPFVVPVLVALGAITWWQFAISMALIVAATVAIARLATGVYRTATLRTGARVRLRDLVPRPRLPRPRVPLPPESR